MIFETNLDLLLIRSMSYCSLLGDRDLYGTWPSLTNVQMHSFWLRLDDGGQVYLDLYLVYFKLTILNHDVIIDSVSTDAGGLLAWCSSGMHMATVLV